MRKNDILEAIEAELCGIIYSGRTLIPHHIVEVISKYRDEEEEVDDWDEHDGFETWNEAPYGDDDDED